MVKNFVEKKFFGPKIFKKSNFWAKNGEKCQSQKFWSKIFLVGIDSECLETYFKTNISKSKFFLIAKFFRGI